MKSNCKEWHHVAFSFLRLFIHGGVTGRLKSPTLHFIDWHLSHSARKVVLNHISMGVGFPPKVLCPPHSHNIMIKWSTTVKAVCCQVTQSYISPALNPAVSINRVNCKGGAHVAFSLSEYYYTWNVDWQAWTFDPTHKRLIVVTLS